MANMDVKSFVNADEVKNPDKTLAQIINFGDVKITKLELEPIWKWSECITPVVGTESCQAGHVGVVTQGKMKAIHNDGTEIEYAAGDAYFIAPGHDGWVVGDEKLIGYEFTVGSKDFGPWTSK